MSRNNATGQGESPGRLADAVFSFLPATTANPSLLLQGRTIPACELCPEPGRRSWLGAFSTPKRTPGMHGRFQKIAPAEMRRSQRSERTSFQGLANPGFTVPWKRLSEFDCPGGDRPVQVVADCLELDPSFSPSRRETGVRGGLQPRGSQPSEEHPRLRCPARDASSPSCRGSREQSCPPQAAALPQRPSPRSAPARAAR
jgi:hypothetical protein